MAIRLIEHIFLSFTKFRLISDEIKVVRFDFWPDPTSTLIIIKLFFNYQYHCLQEIFLTMPHKAQKILKLLLQATPYVSNPIFSSIIRSLPLIDWMSLSPFSKILTQFQDRRRWDILPDFVNRYICIINLKHNSSWKNQ